jgi:mono/diheme cytochrome c family protein
MKKRLILTTALFIITAVTGCGGGETETQTAGSESSAEQGLSAFELEHGIGPVTELIEVNGIDRELADRGREIYQMKCEMCHNMEGRMVGPPLGDVMEKRSPTYVMNMILNPGGMAREHPEGKKLLQEYMTVMPFQNVKEDEARAIVEYLRDYAENN